jgi:predicted nucleic acid-binding protein
VTVLDTSVVIDYLLGTEAPGSIEPLIFSDALLSAPDLITFEILAVFRRQVLRGALDADLGRRLIDLYGQLSIELFPTYPLRFRAWDLRDRLTMADALFLSLAEELNEPLATEDQGLVRMAAEVGVDVVNLA